MTDREMVAQHFEDCIKIADCHINHNWVFVRTEILRDALALLKAQEPRVMTLDEVIEAVKKPAYMETKSRKAYTGWALIYDVQEGMGITGTRIGMTQPGHITTWPPMADYGSLWRCWTNEPSEEQREEAKWDD